MRKRQNWVKIGEKWAEICKNKRREPKQAIMSENRQNGKTWENSQQLAKKG